MAAPRSSASSYCWSKAGTKPELTWTAPVQNHPAEHPGRRRTAVPSAGTAPLGIQAGNDFQARADLRPPPYSGRNPQAQRVGANVVVPLNGMEIPRHRPPSWPRMVPRWPTSLGQTATPTVKNKHAVHGRRPVPPRPPVAMQIVAMARSGVQWQAIDRRRDRPVSSAFALVRASTRNGRTFHRRRSRLDLGRGVPSFERSASSALVADASSEIRIAAALAAARKETHARDYHHAERRRTDRTGRP